MSSLSVAASRPARNATIACHGPHAPPPAGFCTVKYHHSCSASGCGGSSRAEGPLWIVALLHASPTGSAIDGSGTSITRATAAQPTLARTTPRSERPNAVGYVHIVETAVPVGVPDVASPGIERRSRHRERSAFVTERGRRIHR